MATRLLGVVAALAGLCTAGLLVAVRQQRVLTLPTGWALPTDQAAVSTLGFDGASLPLAVLASAGGGLALLSLALTLPASLRGYGGLFAALLLMITATIAGLATVEPLMFPFAWALVVLLGFVALRSSGVQTLEQSQPISLLGGLIGTICLLGAALEARFSGAIGLSTVVGLSCWIVAVAVATGAPPFHRTVDEQAAAPASIGGVVLGLGLPLLGGAALTRFVAQQTGPGEWRLALTLLGLAALLACAAGAARTRHIRHILGWQLSGQVGLLFVALGQNQIPLAVIAPPLLINAALTTLLSYTAVALLERRTGTDDLAAIRLSQPLRGPGLAFAVAAASALGLPGTWGFWSRRWLLDELLIGAPWVVAPLLAGSALLALSYLGPLAAFWRGAPAGPAAPGPQRDRAAWGAQASALLLALPLLVLGARPQIAWDGWGAAAQRDLLPIATVAATPPALPGPEAQAGYGVAAALLLALPLVLRQRARRNTVDPEAQSGAHAPEALGASLGALASLAAPASVFERLWGALLWLSRRLNWALGFIEQRYYLAGLMVAVVAVILLLLQE